LRVRLFYFDSDYWLVIVFWWTVDSFVVHAVFVVEGL
jgi:hypothetical protein